MAYQAKRPTRHDTSEGPLSLRLLKQEQPVMFGFPREAGSAHAKTHDGHCS